MNTLNFKPDVNRVFISLCLTIAFILTSSIGFAQGYEMDGRPGTQGFDIRPSPPSKMNSGNNYVRGIKQQTDIQCQNQRPQDELNLTDKQKKQIDQLRLKYGKSLLPLQNELAEKRANLLSVSTGENVSLSKINKVIESIGSIQIQIMKLQAAMQQDIRKTLTEEQRQKMDLHFPQYHHMGSRLHGFPPKRG